MDQHTRLMQKEWEKNSRRFKSWIGMTGRRPDNDEFHATINDIQSKFEIGSEPIKTVLDVGCNNGFLLHSLHIHATIKVGIDFCFLPLTRGSNSFPDIHFIQGESLFLPFKDNQFDRVLCYNMFHYLPTEKTAFTVSQELFRVLSPSGLLLIGDLFTKEYRHLIPRDDYIKWNSKERPFMHRIENWLFISIKKLKKMFSDLGAVTKILHQSENVRCPGYRLDILIRKRRKIS